MKRVYCLYRVSTAMQVEHDDIPMQKEACRNYVSNNPDWKIEREYLEKGISGYKISANNRDAIQTIRNAATKSEFDVLLVFMFDRLGRRDDETPFLVEWFVRHNIEVWSVMEGQQRFDTHVDKLLNYIRFWQASGESEKLSLRITTKLSQMAEEGIYRGGYVPYGYRLEKQGRINRKGHDVHDLVINPEQAEIIRMIFQKSELEGLSSGAIATFLNAIGIPTKKCAMYWRASSIRAIMKNPIYRGFVQHRGKLHGPFEKYRIISDALFNQVQQNLVSRKKVDKPFSTDRDSLLSGFLTCGSCHEKLAVNHYHEKRKKTPTLRTYYRCYSRTNCDAICDGQSAFKTIRVDAAVQRAVGLVIQSIESKTTKQISQKIHDTMGKAYEEQKMILKKTLATALREEKLLHNALVDSIIGKNELATEIINGRIEEQDWRIKNTNGELAKIEKELHRDRQRTELIMNPNRLGGEVFGRADLATKRKIIEQLIDKIVLSHEYKIDIFFVCSAKGISLNLFN